jgi:deoxyribonuclease V
MLIPDNLIWPKTAEEAITLQNLLRKQVSTEDQIGSVQYVAGADVGFENEGTITRAAVAVLTYPDLIMVEFAVARKPTDFPYIPGLLSFREIPALLEALSQLKTQPDLILVDGHGTAHPRRLGIASHLGVLIDTPTIGVGKSLLVGKYEEVPQERGAWKPLMHRGDTIGAVLRTRKGFNPLFISGGHKVSLATAIDYVLRCSPKYRLPETTRRAHDLASNKAYR